ncbi:MAG TPA: zf-HC2 domain-containing protein [Gaiellaceae bacterium]
MTKQSCDQARSWASLELDGALSSFEQRLLDRHLDRCDACNAYAREVAQLTLTLRAAPLEQPPAVAPRFPARRRLQPAGGLMAAAAVAAAAVFAITTLRASPQSTAFASAGLSHPAAGALIGSAQGTLGVRPEGGPTSQSTSFVRGVFGQPSVA